MYPIYHSHPLNQRFADILGLSNAALCMVHCLAVPLLVASGAAFIAHPAVELFFVGLAAWAVWSATRRSKNILLQGVLWTLLLLFSFGLLLEEVHPMMEWLSMGASLSMVVAHALNLRYRATCA
jgi:hypothetical protein